MTTKRRERFDLRPATLLAVSCLALFSGVQSARAYSDPGYFERPSAAGGGGGRYFTASPLDGYGCQVCHRGGVEPKVHILGLPITGYQPGQTYEIELNWENPSVPHALQLEFLGRDGRVPGQVALLEQAAVDARGRCKGIATAEVAAYDKVAGNRKVLGVEACGAQSLRFRFTPADVADLAFSVSVITSDKSATVEGDGVWTMRRVLRRNGERAQTGDCSLLPAASSGARSWVLACLGLLGVMLCARRLRSR